MDSLTPWITSAAYTVDAYLACFFSDSSQHAQVMRHLWSLITSTVLDSETDAPESEGDDTEGNIGEDAVVQEGDDLDVSGEGAGGEPIFMLHSTDTAVVVMYFVLYGCDFVASQARQVSFKDPRLATPFLPTPPQMRRN